MRLAPLVHVAVRARVGNASDGVGPGQGGPFQIRIEGAFGPGIEGVESLLGFPVFAQIAPVLVQTVGAAVHLRRAKLDEEQQCRVDGRLGEISVRGIHGIVDAGRRSTVVEAGRHVSVRCCSRSAHANNATAAIGLVEGPILMVEPDQYDGALELHVRLDPGAPLSVQIYRQVLEAMRDGTLSNGDRLPPTRELASRLGVSRNTVTVAYELLIADGVLSGQVGSGTFVRTGTLVPSSRQAPVGVFSQKPEWRALCPRSTVAPGALPSTLASVHQTSRCSRPDCGAGSCRA